jgi:hypothetical protein
VLAVDFLVCDNIKERNEFLIKNYYLLGDKSIVLIKNWTVLLGYADEDPSFSFPEKQKYSSVISENDNHIFFSNDMELDKVTGILVIKAKGSKDYLSLQCKKYNKDDFFIAR